jgi:WD domain, G-beta repeat
VYEGDCVYVYVYVCMRVCTLLGVTTPTGAPLYVGICAARSCLPLSSVATTTISRTTSILQQNAVQLSLHQPRAAVKCLEQALAIHPDSPTVLLNLAVLGCEKRTKPSLEMALRHCDLVEELRATRESTTPAPSSSSASSSSASPTALSSPASSSTSASLAAEDWTNQIREIRFFARLLLLGEDIRTEQHPLHRHRSMASLRKALNVLEGERPLDELTAAERASYGGLRSLPHLSLQPAATQRPHAYTGHLNQRTVKEISFFGDRSEYVMTGSDNGYAFIWDVHSGEVVNAVKGDGMVVNVVQPHPFDCALVTSGIDSSLKLWMPTATHPVHAHAIERARVPAEDPRRPGSAPGIQRLLLSLFGAYAFAMQEDEGEEESDAEESDAE